MNERQMCKFLTRWNFCQFSNLMTPFWLASGQNKSVITVENREKIVLDRGVDQKVFTFDYVADIDVPSPNRKSFLRLLNPLLTAASKATMDRSSHMDRQAQARLSRFRGQP